MAHTPKKPKLFIWKRPRARQWWVGAFAAVVAAFTLPAAMAQDSVTTIAVKRYFLMQVSDRCHLLDEPTTRALKAGFVQARNAAIRDGNDMSVLSPFLDKTREAADATPCTSPTVAEQAEIARGAYRRFLTQTSMELPTSRTEWYGDRAFEDKQSWRLVQYQATPQADLALGLYGTLGNNSFSVMANFKDGTKPYSAHLLIRNPDMMNVGLINPEPYGISRDRPVGISDYNDVSFMARASSTATVAMRRAETTNAAGFNLKGQYVGAQAPVDVIRYDFPTKAYRAIARLDPREDIVVVFDCDDGPRYARFEVGDFITGLTYVALPSPYFSLAAN